MSVPDRKSSNGIYRYWHPQNGLPDNRISLVYCYRETPITIEPDVSGSNVIGEVNDNHRRRGP
jgi:hypothetical protein